MLLGGACCPRSTTRRHCPHACRTVGAGRFGKPYSLGVCAAFGGLSKQQQFKELKAGCEV